MAERESLGKVELELLQAVDKLQPVSVRALADHLAAGAGPARTTVLTVLERLRKKGFLSRRKVDGVNHYSPRTAVAPLLQRLVGDFVRQMLGGSVSPFVAYLQNAERIAPEELAELKQLVERLESQPQPRAEKQR